MTHDDFLIELLTEELPPKSLLKLATALHDSIAEQLQEVQLSFTKSHAFAAPRRLAVKIDGLIAQQAQQTIKRLGPSIKAAYVNGEPTKAALAFAQSCGVELSALEQGEKLSFTQTVPGKSIIELMPAIIEKAIAQLPIAKRMRWGAREDSFVRPVHNLLMLFGKTIIPATLWGLASNNKTYGHRFHHPDAITIAHPKEYETLLKTPGYVIANFEARKNTIVAQVEKLAKQHHGEAIMPEALLNEVTALVEWPVAIAPRFEKSFLNTPKESLISAMQEHQKSFALLDADKNLLPLFITISNIESNNPAQVIHGNERVMHARLSDAQFFFNQDKSASLEARIGALKTIMYQAKLGSLFDRTQRIETIAAFIAEKCRADLTLCKRAAQLCKADLSSDMVGEFPELQGTMGYYYALHDNENIDVAIAIKEHYQPKFSGDLLPSTLPGTVVALADRIESLVGLFSIGQIPTGDKDPFGLRRSALGILRIIIEKKLPLDLEPIIAAALRTFGQPMNTDVLAQILTFFQDRLRPWYADQNIPSDVVQSVTALALSNPYDIHQRILAVAQFKLLPETNALAAANKRVSNILKKNAGLVSGKINPALLEDAAEKELYAALEKLIPQLAQKDYAETLKSLASLQSAVDHFFEKVMVMTDNLPLRNNRLALLQTLREQFLRVADVAVLQ